MAQAKRPATKKSAAQKTATAQKTSSPKRPVTVAEAALAKPTKESKRVMAPLFKVPSIPKDAPTAEEHRRLSWQAVEENVEKIATLDEKSFTPHIGKTFTLTSRTGQTGKLTLTHVQLGQEPTPQMRRHHFTTWFTGPKNKLLESGMYELKAAGFPPVELHVAHAGFDGEGEKASKKALYIAPFA